MDYVCPLCHAKMDRELLTILSHGEAHIVDVIKKDHPDWVASDSMCQKCYDHYKEQLHPPPK